MDTFFFFSCVVELKHTINKSLTNSLCGLQSFNENGFVFFVFFALLQKKPRVVQSLGASSVTAPPPPPETRLSAGHVSVDNNLSNSSNVVCTGKPNRR